MPSADGSTEDGETPVGSIAETSSEMEEGGARSASLEGEGPAEQAPGGEQAGDDGTPVQGVETADQDATEIELMSEAPGSLPPRELGVVDSEEGWTTPAVAGLGLLAALLGGMLGRNTKRVSKRAAG